MFKYLNRLFNYIILIFFPMALISSVLYFIEKNNNWSIASILVILTSFLIAIFFIRKDGDGEYLINEKQFIICALSIAIGVRVLEVLIIQTQQVVDYKHMYTGAVSLLNGNFGIGISKSSYWYYYNYQLGFTFYQFLIMKLFNTQNIMVLKAFNVVWTTGIIFLIYKIAKEIFGQDTARVSAIFMMLYVPNILSTSLLTNQHIATFFILLGFYVLVNKNQNKFKYFMVGMFICIGCLMRPVAPIYLTAIVIYVIVDGVYNKYKFKKTFLNLSKIIATYVLIFYMVSCLFITLGMTERTLNKQVLPTWKVLVGTDYDSNGKIGEFEFDLMDKLFNQWDVDYDRFNETAKQEIINRIKDNFPSKYFKLLCSKFYEFWGYNDKMISWSIGHSEETRELFYYYLYGDFLKIISLLQLMVIYIFGCICSLKEVINKKINHKKLLLLIPLSGYIAAHLIIEIQTHYRYSIMPFLFMLSAYGFITVISYFKKYMCKKNIQVLNVRGLNKIKTLLGVTLIFLIIWIFKYYDSEELKIKSVNVNNVDNKYFFSVETSYKDDNLSYAWYIYKDGNDYEKIWYSKNKLLMKDITEDGQYMVKGFVKDSNDKIVSSNSDVFNVDKKNNKELAIEYVDKFMLDDNKYIFIVKPESTEANLLYAWYIYKDGNIYEKIWYSNNNILEKDFNESGKYRIKYFVKNGKNDIETRYFDEIIID